jgi:hypothetical protein
MERTTHQGSLGPDNAPTWTARRTPTAQIRRGLAGKVVAVVRAEIFALPLAASLIRRLRPAPFHFFSVLSPTASVFHPKGNFGRNTTSPVSVMPHLGNWQ